MKPDFKPDPDNKCGFVSVVGLPNAGKSTLINTLVGSKISIVSEKVQTTRMRVLGIVISGKSQVILIDTPGIFRPGKTLEKAMVGAALDSLEEADIIVHLVDSTKKNALSDNEFIIDKLPAKAACVLALNKTDKVKKTDLFALAAGLNQRFSYISTFMISGLKSDGTGDLLSDLAGRVPEGPWMFAPDEITDMPARLMASEITREKIFQQLYQELPHSTFVETEKWEDLKDGSIKIHQVICVQSGSQKAIVLGKGGSRIKQIGEESRLELEGLFDSRVHLKLFVKVQENWAENVENYQLMGLNKDGIL